METNEDRRMRHQSSDKRKLVMSVLIVVWLIPWGNVWAQVTKLNVGYVGINSDNVIAFIAKESGIFAKNGLDVQLIYFGGGTTRK